MGEDYPRIRRVFSEPQKKNPMIVQNSQPWKKPWVKPKK